MGVKFGEIDANQILENEFRIQVLERVLDWILAHNPTTLTVPNAETVQGIKREVLKVLQRKYPNSAIVLTEEEHQPVAG